MASKYISVASQNVWLDILNMTHLRFFHFLYLRQHMYIVNIANILKIIFFYLNLLHETDLPEMHFLILL